MTALDIRRALFRAVKANNQAKIVALAKEIVARDLFLGEKAIRTGHEKHIPISEYPGRCGECGDQIPIGEAIYWGKGVGQWHEECY